MHDSFDIIAYNVGTRSLYQIYDVDRSILNY